MRTNKLAYLRMIFWFVMYNIVRVPAIAFDRLFQYTMGKLIIVMEQVE